jgi:hypothetical protein
MNKFSIEMISPLHGDENAIKKILLRINKKKVIFSIDSNIFRNRDFINYMCLSKHEIQFILPTIVQFEVGFYFRSKGFELEEFMDEISDFEGIFLSWNNNLLWNTIETAYSNKTLLPFNPHIRDYIIGMESKLLQIGLISYNKKHFHWMNPISVLTPEEFILKYPANF